MRFLKQNTATRVTVGPFLDKTDGVTPETSLTVTSCKLTLMVDDAGVPTLVLDTNPTASAGNNDMVHVTGDDAGFYDLELTAANLNYVGRAMLALTDAATHCPVFHEFTILPANIYDSFIGGTDLFDVSVTQWTGTNVASPDTAGYPKVTVKSGTGTGEVSLSSGAVLLQATQSGVTIPTVTTLTNAPSDSSGVTTLLSRLSSTRAGYLDNLSAGAVALEATAQSVLSKMLKYVQLIVRKDSAIATDNATELTAINANGGSGAGAFANTTDAQEAIRDRGDSAWVTATGFATHTAADVWAVATRLLTAGTNIVLAKGTGVTGFNDLSAAQVNAEVDTALADYDAPTKAELDSGLAALQAELDGIQADTEDIQSKIGTPAVTLAADIADLPTNAELATSQAAADDTTLAAIAALNNLSAAQVNAEVDTALADYDGPTNAEMVARTLAAASYATATALATAQTSIDDIPTNAELATSQAAADDAVLSAITALNNLSSSAVGDAVLDEVVEGSYTLRQMIRVMAAALAGELSGAGTSTITIRDMSDTKTRVTATVDADGNRSALTLDAT